MVGVSTGLAVGEGASPLAVVTLRTLGTLAVLTPYLALIGLSFALPRRDALLALAIGLPLSLNNYLINAAFAELPVPLVVLTFYLWPALASSVTWALGHERFSWRGAAGLVLAFAGVGMALNVDLTAAQTYGAGLALAAAMMWSLVFLLTGRFFRGRDTRMPTFYMIVTAAVVFIAACIVSGGAVLPRGGAGWTGVAGTIVFYSVAMIAIFPLSARAGGNRTAFFLNFEPVAAVLFSALLLGQTLAPVQLAGAALVVCALFLFRPPS